MNKRLTIKSVLENVKKTEFVLFFMIIAIFFIMSFATETFLTLYNLQIILTSATIVGILSIASTLIIISGGIDLSIGSVVGLSAMVCAVFMSSDGKQMGVWPSILLSVLLCIFVGIYHAVIIYEVKIDSFIATLASNIFLRGIIKLLSDSRTVTHFPKNFNAFAQIQFLGLPSIVWIWLFIGLVCFFILRYTRFGRNLFVLGSGLEVARLAGINTRLTTYAIYSLGAFLCSIAGILMTSRLSSAQPTGGTAYLMPAITAAVIGGASLKGAKGSIIGTLLGTILMTIITNAGIHLEINTFVMESATGVLLTLAVVLDILRQKKE